MRNSKNSSDKSLLGSIFRDEETYSASSHRSWKRKTLEKFYSYTLLAIDIICITILFSCLSSLYHSSDFFEAISRRVLLAIAFPSVLSLWLIGGYSYQTQKNSLRFASEHIIASFCATLAGVLLIYVFISYGVKLSSSRLLVGMTFFIFPLLSIVYRFFLSQVQFHYDKNSVLVLVGENERAQELYLRLREHAPDIKVRAMTFVKTRIGKRLVADSIESPILLSAQNLDFNYTWNNRYFVRKYIIITDPNEISNSVARKLSALVFTRENIVSYRQFFSSFFSMEPPNQLNINWPMMEGFRLNRNVGYDRVKRFLDVTGALLGIVLLSPLLLLTALLVKCTSKGPILFKQPRTGLREKTFMLFKFRSMTVGSEKGAKYTDVDDIRFTSIGKFIRKVRLDELPQFFNVLIGDMSLIGPRAEWVDLVKEYEKSIPFYHYRHAIKPGITGWAQVNYSYGACEKDTIEKLNYDLYYVRRYSLALDITTILKTFYTVFFGKGM